MIPFFIRVWWANLRKRFASGELFKGCVLKWYWAILWEPRDLWFGLFWDVKPFEISLYFCIIPMLPLRLQKIRAVASFDEFATQIGDPLDPVNYHMVSLRKWAQMLLDEKTEQCDYAGVTEALAFSDDRKLLTAIGPVLRTRFRITLDYNTLLKA
jgi:hypothetical protein